MAQPTAPGTRAKDRLGLMTFGRVRSREHYVQPLLLGIVVGLGVAPVLELGGVGIEAHELLEDPVLQRELHDRSTRGVLAHDIAVLEEVVQQRAGFSPWGKRQGHDCHGIASMVERLAGLRQSWRKSLKSG
jgi:hypothetical protein